MKATATDKQAACGLASDTMGACLRFDNNHAVNAAVAATVLDSIAMLAVKLSGAWEAEP